MTYIHWDTNPDDGIDDGIYFIAYGKEVPVYGLNGGANWTNGQVGGSTLDADGRPLPSAFVDRIDKFFWDHDRAYDLEPTADVIPEADLKLATQLVRLNDRQLSDPEARFYAGIATLAMLYRVEQADPGLVSPLREAVFTADATHNIAAGLAGMEPYEQQQAVELLSEFAALLVDDVVPLAATVTTPLAPPALDSNAVAAAAFIVFDAGAASNAGPLADALQDGGAVVQDVATSVLAHWTPEYWFA